MLCETRGRNIANFIFYFLNDLAKGIKNLNLGVEIEPGFNVSILLFADDIVLLSPTEEQLQILLNFLSDRCNINKMEVNINKTKIIHFRKKCCERIHVDYHLSGLNIEICENYKYLGIILNEFSDFTETANVLSEAAGRAFSSLVINLYNKTDLMYSSYTKIYDSKLVPITDYCSSV